METSERWHPYLVLDVFTDVPLQGNPLAVFTDAGRIPGELLQRVARELNLSETAFVLPPEGDEDAHIRIFTPSAELPFAGHPTLGSAFVVADQRASDLVRLRTGAGLVPVALRREDSGRVVYGEMEQPLPSVEQFDRSEELLRVLGIRESALPVEAYCNGPVHVYVALPDEASVAALRPDLGALAAMGEFGVACFAGDGAHVKSRNFAPGLGVPEDPATGSAAGPLALHLARHGLISFGQEIEIRQGVEIGRPSLLRARARGTAERVEQVTVGGAAVVVARGEYRLG